MCAFPGTPTPDARGYRAAARGAPGDSCECARSACSYRLNAKARVDRIVEEIDHQVDDDEKEPDQAKVSRHHGHVGEADRLDEEQPHPGPLEHLLGDDREGDDGAE